MRAGRARSGVRCWGCVLEKLWHGSFQQDQDLCPCLKSVPCHALVTASWQIYSRNESCCPPPQALCSPITPFLHMFSTGPMWVVEAVNEQHRRCEILELSRQPGHPWG